MPSTRSPNSARRRPDQRAIASFPREAAEPGRGGVGARLFAHIDALDPKPYGCRVLGLGYWVFASFVGRLMGLAIRKLGDLGYLGDVSWGVGF